MNRGGGIRSVIDILRRHRRNRVERPWRAPARVRSLKYMGLRAENAIVPPLLVGEMIAPDCRVSQ
jgi:hypothetical protein